MLLRLIPQEVLPLRAARRTLFARRNSISVTKYGRGAHAERMMTMNDSLSARVRSILTKEGVFVLGDDLAETIRRTSDRLPRAQDVSDDEQRCPTTLAGIRANLDRLFVRHLHQVQESLLLPEAFDRLDECCKRGAMRIADIGSGLGAAAMAAMDVANKTVGMLGGGRGSSLATDIVLNDVSEPALAEGQRMLRSAASRIASRLRLRQMVPLSTPFPASAKQLRRIAGMLGPYDFIFMSYSLVSVKEEALYTEIAGGLRCVTELGEGSTCGIILQDKFHESMARRLAGELGVSCNKVTIRQEVHDRSNSNEVQSYTFFRSVLSGKTAPVTVC